MKKQFSNLGKALSRLEQKSITGGNLFICCYANPSCPPYNETSCVIIGGVCNYFAGEGVPC